MNPNSIYGRDRRRTTRHGVHSPAYANLAGSAQGAALELCEILNISESGMCIQASTQMKVNRLLALALEFSETGARIHVVGHVVWSEPSGRTGIRFPDMSESSSAQLQQWLATNARAETVAMAAPVLAPTGESRMQSKPNAASGYTSLVNEWAEIEKEIELCGPDLDPALHLIAQRALTMTWASGTAIALINKLRPSEMICRARAGSDSPEIGARLQAGSGFSGECVRSGTSIACDDTEYDSRVDRANCRALGIRSIVACPIKRNDDVIGIIEVFSPEPAAFWENDITILQKLGGVVARAVRRAEHARADVLAFPTGDDEEAGSETPSFLDAHLNSSSAPLGRRIALLFVAMFCITAAVWAFAPWIAKIGSDTSNFAIQPAAEANSSTDSYSSAPLKDVKKLAISGNAAAQYSLGMRYANGDGLKRDNREARQWFLKAAEQGHIAAEGKVAASFWEGSGGAQDYSKAYFWGLLAQAGGDETSSVIVMSSAAHLSPAQISAEQKQAESWLHSHHIGHSD